MPNEVDNYFAHNPGHTSLRNRFSDVFQISYIDKIKIAKSNYILIIYKPLPRLIQRFGIGPEILCLYSPYHELQARDLTTARDLQTQKFKDRVHPAWNIIISDSNNIEEELYALTQGKDLETYTIPFNKSEIEQSNYTLITDRLEKYVHGRDLFSFQSALQSDTFFFGRSKVVDELVGQVENGQNFGLFGLRKTGKTSVLLAVERKLKQQGQTITVHLDCQDPSIFNLRWNVLLSRIYHSIVGGDFRQLSDESISSRFKAFLKDSGKRIFLALDEIENITFNISPSKHWNQDFQHFWGTLRAIQQTSYGQLSFGVVGVNPYIIETPTVAGRDNPILLAAKAQFIDQLDSGNIRIMLREIGKYMGIVFDEDCFSWLSEQFGGHPLLSRQVCSFVYRQLKFPEGQSKRITLNDFTERQKRIEEEIEIYIQSMLTVLAQYYPKEYDHLIAAAKLDYEWIELIKEEDPRELFHLYSYQILKDNNAGKPTFTIHALQPYLVKYGEKYKKSVELLTSSSMINEYHNLPAPEKLSLWIRLTTARNQVEPLLRKLICKALMFKYGESQALQEVYKVLGPEKQKEMSGHKLIEIFNGETRSLYFVDLKKIALKYWDLVQHALGSDRRIFETHMDMINSEGRADAHAKPVVESDVIGIERIASQMIERISPFVEI